MNIFKLSVAVLAVVFVISCGDNANVQNSKTSVANVAAINSTTSGATNGAPIGVRKNPQAAADVDDLALTDDLYAENCMVCHKDTGKGGKVTIKGKNLNAVDLTSEKMRNRSDEQLARNISDGEPEEGMPAFKGKLTDEQIKMLVARVRELQSNP